jgi:hypothetical protein
MNWEVERDNSGRVVRMWWKGSGGKPKTRAMVRPGVAPCPSCGFLFGWHTQGCSNKPTSNTSNSSETQDLNNA